MAQTYDGAAVMWGAYKPIFERTTLKPVCAFLCTYMASACRAVSEAKEFFDMLESVYTFF